MGHHRLRFWLDSPANVCMRHNISTVRAVTGFRGSEKSLSATLSLTFDLAFLFRHSTPIARLPFWVRAGSVLGGGESLCPLRVFPVRELKDMISHCPTACLVADKYDLAETCRLHERPIECRVFLRVVLIQWPVRFV